MVLLMHGTLMGIIYALRIFTFYSFRMISRLGEKVLPSIYWIDHVSSVNDIFLTKDSSSKAQMLTCSNDGYCNVYSFMNDKKILSLKVGTGTTCCLMDSLEHLIFIGGSDGKIHYLSINTIRPRIVNETFVLVNSTAAEPSANSVLAFHR